MHTLIERKALILLLSFLFAIPACTAVAQVSDTINSEIGQPEVLNTPLAFMSVYGNDENNVEWSLELDADYSFRLGSCEGTELSGENTTGRIDGGSRVTTTFPASDLTQGANEVFICVTKDGFSDETSLTVTREDQRPDLTLTVDGQEITSQGADYDIDKSAVISCDDTNRGASGCKRMVYTVDGTAPNFSPVVGTLVEGDEATVELTATETVLRYMAEDEAGNQNVFREKIFTNDVAGFVYLGTNSGLARGVGPNPEIFRQLASGSAVFHALEDTDNGKLFAATVDGLFISGNGGNDWQFRSTANGLAGNSLSDMVLTENGTLYIASSPLDVGSLGGGLSISRDGGTSFVRKTENDGLIDRQVRYIEKGGDRIWFAVRTVGLSYTDDDGGSFESIAMSDNISGMVANPDDADELFVATNNYLYYTDNGGQSFTQLNASNGINNMEVNLVQVDFSRSPAVVFIGTSDGGQPFQISTDGGQNFTGLTTPAGFTGFRIFYRENRLFLSGFEGGLSNLKTYASSDDGQTYEELTEWAGNLILSVEQAGDGLIVGTYQGVYLSDSNFENLSGFQLGNGMEFPQISALLEHNGKLFAGITGALSGNSLFVSEDGGFTFENVNITNGITLKSLKTADGDTGNRIYAGTVSGLYYSNDFGESFNVWDGVLSEADVQDFYISEKSNGDLHIYVGTDSGIDVSTNSGGSFAPAALTGFSTNSVRAIAGIRDANPANSDQLFVGTVNDFGYSINYGATFAASTDLDGLDLMGAGTAVLGVDIVDTTAYITVGDTGGSAAFAGVAFTDDNAASFEQAFDVAGFATPLFGRSFTQDGYYYHYFPTLESLMVSRTESADEYNLTNVRKLADGVTDYNMGDIIYVPND